MGRYYESIPVEYVTVLISFRQSTRFYQQMGITLGPFRSLELDFA